MQYQCRAVAQEGTVGKDSMRFLHDDLCAWRMINSSPGAEETGRRLAMSVPLMYGPVNSTENNLAGQMGVLVIPASC